MSRFPKKEPWPEEQVTSQAHHHISQLHNQLDQLMAQADLIAAYMPSHPAILTRPVVNLNSSMIVMTQDDKQALRDLRQDIAQKQTDFDAYDQQYDKEYEQRFEIEEDNSNALPSDKNRSNESQDEPINEIANDEIADNEIQALIRSYVIRCLEEEAPKLIRDESISLLSAELKPSQKRKKQSQ